jgi:ATP-dependent RNA circularization protein (DNA/RNA ligase family)
MEQGGGRIGICSRSRDFLAHDDNLFWKVALELDLPKKIQEIGGDIAIQGELVGSSILGNSMGFAEGEHAFLVFAIFDIGRQSYMSVSKTMEICERLNLAHTPVIRQCRLKEFASDLNDLIRKAEGTGMKGRTREGLVFKTMDGQKQFKVISNEWLIQKGE